MAWRKRTMWVHGYKTDFEASETLCRDFHTGRVCPMAESGGRPYYWKCKLFGETRAGGKRTTDCRAREIPAEGRFLLVDIWCGDDVCGECSLHDFWNDEDGSGEQRSVFRQDLERASPREFLRCPKCKRVEELAAEGGPHAGP